jgi:hypothetical protein
MCDYISMDIIPPITAELNASLSLPIKYIICACIAGAANKIYDDVDDNSRLSQFKTAHNVETLKGIHYITLTILSIAYPLFFIMMYVTTFINRFLTPSSFELPYENSLFYSFALLFLFLDYSKINAIANDEYYFITISILCVAIEEVYDYISKRLNKNDTNITLLTEEVSHKKLWFRIALLSSLIFWYLKCNLSGSIQCFIFYYIAYLAISCCIQFYSLYIYKPPQQTDTQTNIETYINVPENNK